MLEYLLLVLAAKTSVGVVGSRHVNGGVGTLLVRHGTWEICYEEGDVIGIRHEGYGQTSLQQACGAPCDPHYYRSV